MRCETCQRLARCLSPDLHCSFQRCLLGRWARSDRLARPMSLPASPLLRSDERVRLTVASGPSRGRCNGDRRLAVPLPFARHPDLAQPRGPGVPTTSDRVSPLQPRDSGDADPSYNMELTGRRTNGPSTIDTQSRRASRSMAHLTHGGLFDRRNEWARCPCLERRRRHAAARGQLTMLADQAGDRLRC